MARFWVGDLHLGHGKIAATRGFNTTDEHDDKIMNQLHRLSADDQVWVMGDISSGKPENEARALELLREVPAKLHLIEGNHDGVSSIHRNGHKHQKRWLEVFESVQAYTRWRLHGKNILGSHYPYGRSGDGPDRGEARYLEWRLPDRGFGLIHAHTHATTAHMELYGDWELQVLDHGQPKSLDTQQMCVSWDVRRGLATEHELSAWAKTLPK